MFLGCKCRESRPRSDHRDEQRVDSRLGAPRTHEGGCPQGPSGARSGRPEPAARAGRINADRRRSPSTGSRRGVCGQPVETVQAGELAVAGATPAVGHGPTVSSKPKGSSPRRPPRLSINLTNGGPVLVGGRCLITAQIRGCQGCPPAGPRALTSLVERTRAGGLARPVRLRSCRSPG